MKNLYLWLLVIVFAGACRGPEGPPGPQGPPGNDGYDGYDGESAYVFQYEVDFISNENFEVGIPFPDDFPTYASDVVLVYLLWNEDDGIWRQLPQSHLMDYGWLQYNFDFTMDNVFLFLEADFPLNLLDASYTNNQIVRIVVVPGDFVENGRQLNTVDFSDYNAVKDAYGLPDIALPEGFEMPVR